MEKKKTKTNKTADFSTDEMGRYLIDTVREVIEVSRKPVPVLDKSGQPTGATEYQSATVLKACELMAKLMGTLKEDNNKPLSVQIVSYRDLTDSDETG